MNLCSACGSDFASVSDFDTHRVGEFPQKGPSEYLVRVRLGLEEGEWTREKGRRCLEEEEMLARGWRIDKRGRWTSSIENDPKLAALRKRVEQRAPETA